VWLSAVIWTKTRRKSKPAKFDLAYISLDGNIGCPGVARV
jgi:succinyl-CoA synthetase beta subunit